MTTFLSVPFVEFPCQSLAAESQPRINLTGDDSEMQRKQHRSQAFSYTPKKRPKNKAEHKGNGKCRSAGQVMGTQDI